MTHRIIRNEADLMDLGRLFGGLKLPFTVEWHQGADRSLSQNALMWRWAGEAAEQRGDMTADEVQREWKLRHGVPILRADSEQFRAVYDAALRSLTYPMKLELMRHIAVTSDMTVRQMVRFLDAVDRECADNGIRLTEPDPDLAKYQSRYRQQPRQQAA